MGIWEMSAWDLVKAGGPVMAPILLCSVFAFAITVEKLWFLASIRGGDYRLKEEIFDLIKSNKIKEALQLCESNPSPVARIIKAGIEKSGSSREEMKESIENVSLFEIPRLESKLNALSVIANVSPLLGLLGTIGGIAATFQNIQLRAAALNPITPGDLAGGIWQALITTAAGLIIAIPAFVVYNYLLSRVNAVILQMEKAATELLNLLGYISEAETAKKGRLPIEI